MNQAHIHLLLNHLPVMGTIFGFLILLLGYGTGQPIIRRVALGVFMASAVFALPAFLTGEGAEETVEGMAEIQGSFIETHEDWGSIYVWCMGGLGIISLLTLLFDWRKSASSRYLYLVTLVVALGTIAVATRVSNSGGEIRHTEIRKDAITQTRVQDNGGDEDED